VVKLLQMYNLLLITSSLSQFKFAKGFQVARDPLPIVHAHFCLLCFSFKLLQNAVDVSVLFYRLSCCRNGDLGVKYIINSNIKPRNTVQEQKKEWKIDYDSGLFRV
jgi:hypothetical protein